jgi:transposase
MNIDLAALPDDVDTLQRMVRTLATECATLTDAEAEIERLRLTVQKLQRSQFGRRAERLDDDQLLFGLKTSTLTSRGSKPSPPQSSTTSSSSPGSATSCSAYWPLSTLSEG